jgi:hypothetical protein
MGVFLLLPMPAKAANQDDRGLLITPLRQQIRLDAGTNKNGSFVVANLTNKPITVHLLVQEFSVENYSYTYRFTKPNKDWIKLGLTETTLASGQSQTIPFNINTPASAVPGGYYYSLMASSQLGNGKDATVQAATLLYVTVNGTFITSGQIADPHIDRLVFGRDVHYSLDATNTGNIYYFAYIAGRVDGLFGSTKSQPTAHLLLPDKIRHISGVAPAPFLPGVYRATFGYYTDEGTSTNISTARWIVVMPPWFIALILATILFRKQLIGHGKKIRSIIKRSTK